MEELQELLSVQYELEQALDEIQENTDKEKLIIEYLEKKCTSSLNVFDHLFTGILAKQCYKINCIFNSLGPYTDRVLMITFHIMTYIFL